MTTLQRQIAAARGRLTMNLLLEQLTLGVLVGAALWAIAVIVVRLLELPVSVWQLGQGAALVAVGTGIIGTLLARPTPLAAAVALDQAAGLKERTSTAWSLRDLNDPFARAAIADAEKQVGRVHVPTHIRRKPPGLWPWSTAAVVSAALLAQFLPPLGLFAEEAQAAPRPDIPRDMVVAEQQAIKTAFEEKADRLKELSKDNADLADLADELENFEFPDKPGVQPADTRREALKRIDSVRDRLEQQIQGSQAERMEAVKRLFNKLDQNTGMQGQSQLSKALANGDMKSAQQELQKLKEQIQEAAKNADDPAAKQKLQKLQQQLDQLAGQLSKLSDNERIQKELENKAGMSKEAAEQLMKQLAQMDPKQLEKELQKRLADSGMTQQQMQQLAQKIAKNQQAQQAAKQLAQALQQAAQGCQQCQQGGSSAEQGSSSAANALSNAAGQLSQLEMTEQMLNDLQATLNDMSQLRDGVCRGDGMGNSPPQDWFTNDIGGQGPQAGRGLGERIGRERTAYQRDPSKAKTRFQGGDVVGTMLIDGPQVRGEASAEVLGAAEAEIRDAVDAVDKARIPRQYDKTLREYFERLAGLVRERQAGASDAAGDAGDAE
jgi:chemotaxis protein histidine kinase CheA